MTNRSAFVLVLVAASLAGACSKKPAAMSVCKQIEGSGVGKTCRDGTPEGLGAAAVEKTEFDLPSVVGKTGAVYRFENEAAYERTVESFEKMATLAGPHRYGSKKALIFVQMNSGLSMDEGRKVKALVDAL